jgi:hypothetical protein
VRANWGQARGPAAAMSVQGEIYKSYEDAAQLYTSYNSPAGDVVALPARIERHQQD